MNCEVCKKPDHQKPMCFRGMKWCSDNHRKVLTGELPAIVEEKDEVKATQDT